MDTNASRVGLARVHVDDPAVRHTAERRQEIGLHAFKVTARVCLCYTCRCAYQIVVPFEGVDDDENDDASDDVFLRVWCR